MRRIAAEFKFCYYWNQKRIGSVNEPEMAKILEPILSSMGHKVTEEDLEKAFFLLKREVITRARRG